MPTLQQIITTLTAIVMSLSAQVGNLNHNPSVQQAAVTTSSEGQVLGVATPAFVQQNTNQITSGASNQTSFSTANTAGNLIVVYAIWDNTNTATVSDTNGNTYTSAVGPTALTSCCRAQIFYAKNIAGGNNTVNVTFSTAASSFALSYIHEYSGIDTVSPIDVTSASSGTASAISSGSATTANANDLIFGGMASGDTVTSAGSGFVARSSAFGNMTEDKVVTSTGSYNVTGTQNSNAWVAQMVAFKAGAASTDVTPPSVPSGFSATTISSSQINLTWSASTDDTSVTGYRIYRNGTQIGTSATNSYSDSGLLSSTAYSYTVLAYDSAGNTSSQSSSASATTQAPAPSSPVISSFTSSPSSITSGGSSNLSWNVSGVISISISGGVGSVTPVTSGSTTVSPSVTTSYTLTATNAQGSVTAQTTVTVSVGGSTYYISPSGSDSNTGLSTASPFKTFSKAFSSLPAGGTLIMMDGTYTSGTTGLINIIDGSSNSDVPPNGISASQRTTIRALNQGAAKHMGSIWLGTKTATSQYLTFDGLYVEADLAIRPRHSSYITFKNIGAKTTCNDDCGAMLLGDKEDSWPSTHHILVEDSWFWGKSRGIAMNYWSQYNVWRRVVVRGDGCNGAGCVGSGNPNIGITVYASQYTSLQNVFVVDRILGGGRQYADFAQACHDPLPHGNNEWLGNMSLNSEDAAAIMDPENSQGTMTFKDFVIWNPGFGGIAAYTGDATWNFDNTTIYLNTSAEDAWGFYLQNTAGGRIRSATVFGTASNGSAVSSGYPVSYTDVNGIFGSGAFTGNTCSTGCKTTNPSADGTPPSIKYPVRIEAGSALKGTGYGGSDYGANIMYRYGVDGAVWGDTNYNTLTSAQLWPWPNQDRIKKEMCTDSGVTRGFCGSTSLTKYIWEAAGNPMPANLYGTGGTSDTISPITPTNLSAAAISSSAISLTWTASTDAVGVTGYKIYRAGTQIGTSATNSYSDSGLTAGTAYSYTVSAYDAAGNTSAQSTSASATTQSGTIPPSTKFTTGQRIQATPGTGSNLNVRATASASGTLLGTQPNGVLGTIVSGGTSVGGYYWWNINFDSGVDGYAAEDYLSAYAASVVGDFNSDGLVNSIDLSLLTSAWNTNTSAYDLNHDSIVNSLDYAVMVQNWSL